MRGIYLSDKILIPLLSYNYGRYLPECLESILLQTHKNWKVVVRDPGSIDNTEQVISYYTRKDSRITYIREKDFLTIGAARNRTINENPHFPIIAYHDVDDIMMPDRLELSIKALSDSNIIYGNGKCFGLHNNISTSFPYVNFKLLSHYNLISGGSVCFRRNVWKSVGGFYEGDDIHEDHDFWLRVAKAGFKFKYINKILYHYRVHSKSITHRMKRKHAIERDPIKGIILQLLSKSWKIYNSINSSYFITRMRIGDDN